MPKLPCIHIYPGDWLRDTVSGCSLAAQALWLRMMFIGHDSDRYGYLSQHGKPIPPGSIAQRCGCTLPLYLSLLSELDDFGVPSRTPEGIIYSRRMVRDGQKRELAAERQRNFKKRNKVSNAGVTQNKRASNVLYDTENENSLVVTNLKSKKKANYEDLRDFCVKLTLPESDAEYLFNHWEGNGWTNGGRPIRDWQRTIRAWKLAGHLPSQKNDLRKKTGRQTTFEEQKIQNTITAVEEFGRRHEKK